MVHQSADRWVTRIEKGQKRTGGGGGGPNFAYFVIT